MPSAQVVHSRDEIATPQTNGMVERFNGRIADVVGQTRFTSAAELDATLMNYATTYNNHIPQRALHHMSPVQAVKQWQSKRPELFVKRVHDQPGLDSQASSPIGGLPARGRRPRRDCLVGDPQRQAAAAAKAGVVLGPIRQRVPHLRDVVSAVGVLLVGRWVCTLRRGQPSYRAAASMHQRPNAPHRALYPAPPCRAESPTDRPATRGHRGCQPGPS